MGLYTFAYKIFKLFAESIKNKNSKVETIPTWDHKGTSPNKPNDKEKYHQAAQDTGLITSFENSNIPWITSTFDETNKKNLEEMNEVHLEMMNSDGKIPLQIAIETKKTFEDEETYHNEYSLKPDVLLGIQTSSVKTSTAFDIILKRHIVLNKAISKDVAKFCIENLLQHSQSTITRTHERIAQILSICEKDFSQDFCSLLIKRGNNYVRFFLERLQRNDIKEIINKNDILSKKFAEIQAEEQDEGQDTDNIL